MSGKCGGAGGKRPLAGKESRDLTASGVQRSSGVQRYCWLISTPVRSVETYKPQHPRFPFPPQEQMAAFEGCKRQKTADCSVNKRERQTVAVCCTKEGEVAGNEEMTNGDWMCNITARSYPKVPSPFSVGFGVLKAKSSPGGIAHNDLE